MRIPGNNAADHTTARTDIADFRDALLTFGSVARRTHNAPRLLRHGNPRADDSHCLIGNSLQDSTLSIRAYRAGDRDAVIRLHQELQLYERAFRPSRAVGLEISRQQVDEYETMLNDEDEDAHLIVADAGDELIGFAFFLVEDELLEEPREQVYVQDLMVTANRRRSGTGTRIMQVIRELMAHRGIRKMDLQVLVGNEAAIEFYRAQGFEPAYLGLKSSLPDLGE